MRVDQILLHRPDGVGRHGHHSQGAGPVTAGIPRLPEASVGHKCTCTWLSCQGQLGLCCRNCFQLLQCGFRVKLTEQPGQHKARHCERSTETVLLDVLWSAKRNGCAAGVWSTADDLPPSASHIHHLLPSAAAACA